MAVISVKKGTRRRQQPCGFRRTDREVLKQTAAQDQDPPSLLHYSRVPVERGGRQAWQANLDLDLMAGRGEGRSVG